MPKWPNNAKGKQLYVCVCTLSSLPIYLMSLLVIPRKVCARLEKIQRDFLWGGGALEKKPHLVNWSAVCTNMRQGGLGIRSLVALNKALLGKWNWKFAIERNSLWKQVIIDKYGEEEGGWCSKEVRGLWCGIVESHQKRLGNHSLKIPLYSGEWEEGQILEGFVV